MGPAIETEGKNWRDIGLQWLISQGVSTVLLFCILSGGGYGVYAMVPKHLQQIQEGYRDITNQYERTVKQLVDSQDKERQALLSLVRQIRDENRDKQ